MSLISGKLALHDEGLKHCSGQVWVAAQRCGARGIGGTHETCTAPGDRRPLRILPRRTLLHRVQPAPGLGIRGSATANHTGHLAVPD